MKSSISTSLAGRSLYPSSVLCISVVECIGTTKGSTTYLISTVQEVLVYDSISITIKIDTFQCTNNHMVCGSNPLTSIVVLKKKKVWTTVLPAFGWSFTCPNSSSNSWASFLVGDLCGGIKKIKP